MIGPYSVLGEIARGGFGVVLKAQDRRTGELVAIKRLRDVTRDPVELERFRREADAASRLRHPNVVSLLASGTDESGPYHVFELVEGRSLRDVLRTDGPLAPQAAAELGAALAAALQHAHDRGVLHRDVKPDNVLVEATGRPRLADFGLARLWLEGRNSLTASNEIVGTPVYMAPEQIQGDRRALGPRTDVYGLGATLYAALTGAAPFAGAGADVLRHVVHDDPAPPPGVDPELSRIVLRCLAKSPAERFVSAADLARALRAWLEARRFVDSDLTTAKLGRPPVSRARALVLGAVAAAAVLGVGAAVFWSALRVPPPAPAPPPSDEALRVLGRIEGGDLEGGFTRLEAFRRDPRVEAELARLYPDPDVRRLLRVSFVADEGSVEEGALLVSRLVMRPGLEPDRYLARLDAAAAALRARVEAIAPARRLEVLVRLQHEEVVAGADLARLTRPEPICLDYALDEKVGIQSTCTVVTLALGRRLGMALEGVCFPERMLVRQQGPPLIFADPFSGFLVDVGALRAELERREDMAWDPAFLDPAPRWKIVLRLAAFLEVRLREHGDARAARARDVVTRLAPRDTDRIVRQVLKGR